MSGAWGTLLEGFFGALLGGLVSVFVAWWIVGATKRADGDVARQMTALAAAEEVQRVLQDLVSALPVFMGSGDLEKLEHAIRRWEDVASIKLPALSSTFAGENTTEALYVVRDWFSDIKHRNRERPIRDRHGDLLWSPTEISDLCHPLSDWLFLVMGNVIRFRSSERLVVLPPRPGFGSPRWDKARSTADGT